MSTIWGVRLAAVFAAVMLSRGQFAWFDCNKMRSLSMISGTLTLLLVYATGEALYRIAKSDYEGRLGKAAVVALGGGACVGVAGFFTMVTHLCP